MRCTSPRMHAGCEGAAVRRRSKRSSNGGTWCKEVCRAGAEAGEGEAGVGGAARVLDGYQVAQVRRNALARRCARATETCDTEQH